MTTPPEPDNGEPREGVNLGKPQSSEPSGETPFDPYRFGKPDHPIPAEYAPPGYTGPVVPPPGPYGPPPPQFASQPYDPYGHQPGPYSQPPYGRPSPYQYPYAQPGQYAPPPYHSYGQPRPGNNGKAIAGLVLGISSIVLCFLSFFDGVLVVLGLIFSLIGMSETKRPGTSGRGLAVAGLICTIVGAALATLFSVLIIHAANQCGGFDNSDAPGWDQCVRDNFG